MYVRVAVVLAFAFAGLVTVVHCVGSDLASDSWTKADEKSLRELISKSDVSVGAFLNPNGLPYHALIVPDEFVESYRKSPIHCLEVLKDIVEHGSKRDAIAAFQFGNAGDKPQIALPPLQYLNTHLIDSRVGKDKDTYRTWCIEILQRKLNDLKTAARQPATVNRISRSREY